MSIIEILSITVQMAQVVCVPAWELGHSNSITVECRHVGLLQYRSASAPSSTLAIVADTYKAVYGVLIGEATTDQKRNFYRPHLHLAPPFGVISSEFYQYIEHQNTRRSTISRGVVCVMIRLVFLIELLTCGGWADAQTDIMPQHTALS